MKGGNLVTGTQLRVGAQEGEQGTECGRRGTPSHQQCSEEGWCGGMNTHTASPALLGALTDSHWPKGKPEDREAHGMDKLLVSTVYLTLNFNYCRSTLPSLECPQKGQASDLFSLDCITSAAEVASTAQVLNKSL